MNYFLAFNDGYQQITKFTAWMKIQIDELTEQEKQDMAIKISEFPPMKMDVLKRE